MEGDAGSGRLNPTPPTPAVDDAEHSDAQEAIDDTVTTAVDEVSPADADADAEVDAPDRRPSRLGGGRWLAGVCAVLLLAGAAVAGGGYLALRSHQKSIASARAETAALAAAKDCVTATQAPDATAMVASQQKIIECATGDFGAQATLYSGVLVDAYQAANVTVQVSDMRAAVERHNDDGSMDILVAMRVRVSNSQSQDQEQGYRLRVRMAPDGGVYKIAKLDQVSK